MQSIWEIRKEKEEGAKPSFVVDGLPTVVEKILISRGIVNQEQVEKVLFPKMTLLANPLSMNNLDKAVERLASAYLKNEWVCIYADYDLDGTSGLALLLTGLRSLGYNHVLYYQPKRLSEGYGFHKEAIDELINKKVSLIVTVDVGITATETVKYAREKGIDVIITDHHLPSEELPPAYAVVNPNQKGCFSGLGYLCGAGVAFYLLRAVKRYFFDHEKFPKNDWDLKEVLDFFTIGTLTDMVPLVDDNRLLVKQGLKVLSATKRPGLRALLEELNLNGRALTSQDVNIRFAPKLNALSRMETEILPIDIFLVQDEMDARMMVRQALKNNDRRVQLQSESETMAQNLLKNWPFADFVYVSSDQFHRGIVGLVATKLAQSLNKPSFVGSISRDGTIVGSARLPQGSDLCLVEAMNSASLYLNRFGGHSQAAGFELAAHQSDFFVQQLNKFFTELKMQAHSSKFLYDAEVSLHDINHQVMKWYDFVGPFGMGFETPLLRMNRLKLKSKKDLKGGHFRLVFQDDVHATSFEALIFGPTHRQASILKSDDEYFDILGELQWNYFSNQQKIQILIKDIKGSP